MLLASCYQKGNRNNLIINKNGIIMRLATFSRRSGSSSSSRNNNHRLGLAVALAATTHASAFSTAFFGVNGVSAAGRGQQQAALTRSLTVNGGGAGGVSLGASKMDQSFKTWSFDKPTETMEWSPLSKAELAVSSDAAAAGWEDDADLVIVGVFAPSKDDKEEEEEAEEDSDEKDDSTVVLSGSAKDLDDKLDGALTHVMEENAKAFKNGAKAGSTTPTLRVFSGGKSQRIIVLGLGKEPKDDKGFESVGSAVGKTIASKCDVEKKTKTAKILLPASVVSDGPTMKDLAAAFHSTLYVDNRFRTGKKVKTPAEDLESVSIVPDGSTNEGAQDSLEEGKKVAIGVHMAKDIVNAPHNVLNSVSLADTARRLAKESGGALKCTILGKRECEERGMGAFLGVARASETEPQFIHITYKPKGDIKKKVGVIGKGLLFDTVNRLCRLPAFN